MRTVYDLQSKTKDGNNASDRGTSHLSSRDIGGGLFCTHTRSLVIYRKGTVKMSITTKAGMTLQDYIMYHVRSMCPVTFKSIQYFLRQQYPLTLDRFEIAEAVNCLIVSGKLELYDDGESFTLGAAVEAVDSLTASKKG